MENIPSPCTLHETCTMHTGRYKCKLHLTCIKVNACMHSPELYARNVCYMHKTLSRASTNFLCTQFNKTLLNYTTLSSPQIQAPRTKSTLLLTRYMYTYHRQLSRNSSYSGKGAKTGYTGQYHTAVCINFVHKNCALGSFT